MEPITIDVTQNTPYGLQKLDSSISFRSFISFLESKIDQEETVKKTFFSLVLDKLKANPAFSKDIPLSEVNNYKEELSLIYGMLMPPIANEKEVFWALSVPVSPVVFYGTSGFYSLLFQQDGNIRCDLIEDRGVNYKQKLQMLYSFILEKLYHFPPLHHPDMIITLMDDASGLQKY